MYGSLQDVVDKPVEVIREHGGFNAQAIGFSPLFLKEKHPDFVFADFMPEPSEARTVD